ncbi:MAG TPA: GNAT family N-acetyltransferase [Hanamia sp.]|nr:GNAT family N-acetyltransferase [Hanamia sp.]
MINWQCKTFSELTNEELYKILQLRNEVFVVEQNCPYQDCDNKDFKAHHFSAWEDGLLVAYTRLLPKGVSYDTGASIGRVLTSPKARGQKLGKELMQKSIDKIYDLYGQTPIIIGAQLYLKRFYESFSFVQQGNSYLEDNIPHIMMEKK